jgi:hypothetical protein
MIMTYTGYLMAALGYIAGMMVLALLWIWLVLVFAEAIAQLWRELVIQCRLSARAFRASSPVRKRRRSSLKTSLAASPSSQLVDAPQRPSNELTHIPEQKQPASTPWDASGRPSILESAPVTTTTLAASTEVASEGVPLFVIDAPLFQADPNVLDARPADLFEILEDTCSAAKAAGYSDEEIARVLAGDSRFARQRLFPGDST